MQGHHKKILQLFYINTQKVRTNQQEVDHFLFCVIVVIILKMEERQKCEPFDINMKSNMPE